MDGRPVTHLGRGIAWMAVGAACNAVTVAFVKHAIGFISVEMTVFARSAVGLVVMLAYIALAPHAKPVRHRWGSQDVKMQVLRGVSAILAIYLTYYALETLDLADTLILSNTLPIFIPLVLFAWKGIRIRHRLWWGIGLSFVGVVMVVHPGVGVFQFASGLALLGAVMGAISTVALRYAHFGEGSATTLFYYFFITFIIAGCVTLFSFQESWGHLSPMAMGWLLLIGLGGLGWQVCFTLAAKNAPVRVTTPLLYISVILGAVIDWWIWNRLISVWEIMGFLCILVGACLVVYLYPKEPTPS